MKTYICANTGKGKTAGAVYLARLYSQLNPNNKIYANFHIEVKNFVYTQFGFLPSSQLLKGNCMIILDDVIQIRNIKPLTEILAVLCRKTNIHMILTCQYYTDIPRKVRILCHYEIEPELTFMIRDNLGQFKMSNKTELIMRKYNPESLELLGVNTVSNIRLLIDGYYNTNEIPKNPSERHMIPEISKFSNDIDELEFNVMLYSGNQSVQKRIIKTICQEKEWNLL